MRISKRWSAAARLLGLLGGLILGSQTPSASALQPYGVNSHWNESTKYAKFKEAGVQMIRLDISWYHVESTQGTFTWSAIDTAMAQAQTQGLQVLCVLGYTNSWATSGPGQTNANQYAPLESYDAAWSNYVSQVVTRYSGQVAAWEIWNEPDHNSFFINGTGTWASNHYPTETAVNKKRLEYKHIVDLALSQAGLYSMALTTSGFALGGSYDTGFVAWLQSQTGWLNQFGVASYHAYGYPSYNRLADTSTQLRNVGAAIGNPWGQWISEHGIDQAGIASGTVKTYLIRSYALGLAQQNVAKVFWFRGGYDPGHMDFYDAANNTTSAWSAYKTLTGKWPSPVSVAAWQSGTPQGSIATMPNGDQVAIVWNDGAGVTLSALGFVVDAAYDQDGTVIPLTSTLTAAPVFLTLTRVLGDFEASGLTNWTASAPRSAIALDSANADTGANAMKWTYNDDGVTQWGNSIGLTFPTAVDWSGKSQLIIRLKKDPANPSADVGKLIYADWVNNGVSTSGGAGVGAITLTSGTTYSTFTINLGSFARSNVTKLTFYVNGSTFNTGNHVWYLDNITLG